MTEEEKNSIEVSADKQSSAEVSQNAKGEFAYKVKLYFRDEEGVAGRAKKLFDELKAEFEGEPTEFNAAG